MTDYQLPRNHARNRSFGHLKSASFWASNDNIAGRKSLLVDSSAFGMPVFETKLFYWLIGNKTDLGAFLSARIVTIHDGAAEGEAFQKRRLGCAIYDGENAFPVVNPEIEQIFIHEHSLRRRNHLVTPVLPDQHQSIQGRAAKCGLAFHLGAEEAALLIVHDWEF